MSNLQVLVIEDDQDVQLGYVQALGLDGIQAQGLVFGFRGVHQVRS